MIKKIAKYITLALLVVAFIYGIGRLSVVMYDSYLFVERQPYLQNATQHSIEVMWQSEEAEEGCVAYSREDSIPKKMQKICDESSTRYHHIKIDGLEPTTDYTYTVASTSLKIDNEGRYFTTLTDDLNATQNIWILGDSGNHNSAQAEVRDAMMGYLKGDKINVWLMLGDNAYRSGTQKQFNRGLFEPYKEILKHNVLWPVIGNHDARRWAFYNIFSLPTQGEAGGVPSASEKYTSFNSGNVHFVLLDSETEDRSSSGDMAKWLKKDLADNKLLWTIAIFHHPPYSKGSHDTDSYYDSRGRMVQMRENIVPILEQHDVDVVLSGHSHVYERSLLSHKQYDYSDTFDAKKHVVQDDLHHYRKCNQKVAFGGTIYNVAGSSSEDQHGINPFNVKHPMLPISFFSTGSLLIKTSSNKLVSTFVLRDGKILDTYTITKSIEACKK